MRRCEPISIFDAPRGWSRYSSTCADLMSTRPRSRPVCAYRTREASGSRQTFGTTTADLLALRDWLDAHGVTHAAMESTGVYWKPVYYVLEERITCLLVNATHVKPRPSASWTQEGDRRGRPQSARHGLSRARPPHDLPRNSAPTITTAAIPSALPAAPSKRSNSRAIGSRSNASPETGVIF